MEIETSGKSLVGRTLDNRYQIESVIGQGGMSTVYKARHLFLKREVAIKVMQEHLASNTEGRLRFQREAQAAASLSHPYIIAVTEFGVSSEGEPYMVMDYLNGISLADLLRDNVRADLNLSVLIFKQVAVALQHAHEKGVLHRDLKPSNVMLVESPTDGSADVRVVDFGLARWLPQAGHDHRSRLTAAGELVGSPYYMSPEQIRDEELDARSDVYSLGCMMYEALTGCRPFSDTNAISVLSMHLYEEPPPFSVVLRPNRIPARIEWIVRKCLEKSRGKRYQSMAELSADLNAMESAFSGSPTGNSNSSASTNGSALQYAAPHAVPSAGEQKSDLGAKSQVAQGPRPQEPTAKPPEPIKSSPTKAPAQSPALSTKLSSPGPKSPAISEVTGSVESAQYTLRLQQPEFARNKFLHWLRSVTKPFLAMARPHFRRFFDTFEGKGQEARRQRVNNTKVLVAALGDSKELVQEAEADAAKYSVYYKNVQQRKTMNAQEFLVLLSTEQFDIVHLHGNFDRRAIFKDSTGFALRLNDVKRACDYSQVKLLWLASANKIEWLKDNQVVVTPSFSLLLTTSRGANFPKFLSSLLSRLSRGDLLPNAWQQIVPTQNASGEKANVKLVPGVAEVFYLP